MGEKMVFPVDVIQDLNGRKNQVIKTHINLLEQLLKDKDNNSYQILRQSFLDAINGYHRSVVTFVGNILDNLNNG